MLKKATRPDERWSTDIMQIQVGAGVYYVVSFMDEYSRYLVHYEITTGTDGITTSAAAQAAIDTLSVGADGKPRSKPEIRSDNGSGYISREFKTVLQENGLGHHRIRPHCPEENGLIERVHRTLRETLDGEELTSLLQAAKKVFGRIVRRQHNGERLSQLPGLSDASGLLSREPGGQVRGKTPPEAGRSPTPTAREEPGVEAAYVSVSGGGDCCLRMTPIGARSDETIH